MTFSRYINDVLICLSYGLFISEQIRIADISLEYLRSGRLGRAIPKLSGAHYCVCSFYMNVFLF